MHKIMESRREKGNSRLTLAFAAAVYTGQRQVSCKGVEASLENYVGGGAGGNTGAALEVGSLG